VGSLAVLCGFGKRKVRARSLAFSYGGVDAGVSCRSFAAHVLWYLGYPDRALESSTAAYNLAQELKYPRSVTDAMDFAGLRSFTTTASEVFGVVCGKEP
jgi:hypothetical protein